MVLLFNEVDTTVQYSTAIKLLSCRRWSLNRCQHQLNSKLFSLNIVKVRSSFFQEKQIFLLSFLSTVETMIERGNYVDDSQPNTIRLEKWPQISVIIVAYRLIDSRSLLCSGLLKITQTVQDGYAPFNH